MRQLNVRSITTAVAIAVSSLTMVACTTTPSGVSNSPRADRATINSEADLALKRLYEAVPGSQELVRKSAGVLVFPNVVGGSFVVGVEHGRGVLRVGNVDRGFYSTTAGSIGWQAGGQSRAIIYVFNTQSALTDFQNSNGFSVGGEASVSVGRVGVNGSLDTTTATTPVTSFVLTNVGLQAGVSLQGSQITPIK